MGATGSGTSPSPEALPPDTNNVWPSGDQVIPSQVEVRPMCCNFLWVCPSKTSSACGKNPELTEITTLPSGEETRFITRSPISPTALPAGVMRHPFGRSDPSAKCWGSLFVCSPRGWATTEEAAGACADTVTIDGN